METMLLTIILIVGAFIVVGLTLRSMLLEARLAGYREAVQQQRQRRRITDEDDQGSGCLLMTVVIALAMFAWMLSLVGGA